MELHEPEEKGEKKMKCKVIEPDEITSPHVAEIHEENKHRQFTKKELEEWLARGNGQKFGDKAAITSCSHDYNLKGNEPTVEHSNEIKREKRK